MFLRKRFFQLILISNFFLLSACGANFTSIYRDYTPVPGQETKTAIIDAKQRAIISAPAKNDTNNNRLLYICAEPSPDALSAISSTFSGSFGFGQPSVQAQAALAAAVKEAAGQLGIRNATIQLLRDGLYRQCEAYMNGFMDEGDYLQIANKYINAMVTLLAIEQITPAKGITTKVSSNDEGVNVSTSTNINVKLPAGDDEETPETPETPVVETGEGDGEEPVAAGGDNNSGSSSGTGSAGAPALSVNLTGDKSEASKDIALAAIQMIQTFYKKDTVDSCLLIFARLSDKAYLSQHEQKTYSVCADIIHREYEKNVEMEQKIIQKLTKDALDSIPSDTFSTKTGTNQ